MYLAVFLSLFLLRHRRRRATQHQRELTTMLQRDVDIDVDVEAGEGRRRKMTCKLISSMRCCDVDMALLPCVYVSVYIHARQFLFYLCACM